MAPRRRIVIAARLGAGLVGLVLGVITAVVIGRGAPGGLPVTTPTRVALLLAAGWSLFAVGSSTLGRRASHPSAALRLLAGCCWFAALWDFPSVGSSALFGAALVAGIATPVLVGHALLADGERPLGRIAGPLIAAGYLITVGPALVGALFFDSAVQGCPQCPANPWTIGSDPGIVATAGRVTVIASALVPTVFAALVVRRLVESGAATRRVEGPTLAGGIVYLAIASAASWRSAGRPFLRPDGVTDLLLVIQAAALVVAALGALWPAVYRRLIRSRVATLVARTGAPAELGALQGMLAHTINDPDLRVLYPLTSGALVDAQGGPAAPDPNAETTPLLRGGRTVAVLSHRSGALGRDQLDAVAAAAGLALDAERWGAERRAQLQDLRESRARLARAGRLERRRLERDLHDGAQQQLVIAAVAVQVAMLRSADPARSAALEAVRRTVNDALGDLREVAQGLRADDAADSVPEGVGAR